MRLSTTYIFYADTYFVQNFVMKLAALLLALWSHKIHIEVSYYRMLLFCGIGTSLEVILLMWGGSFSVTGLYAMLEIPLIMYLLLKKEKRLMIRLSITSLFFIIVLNGILEILWNWFGEFVHFGLLLLMACTMGSLLIRRLLLYARSQKGIYPVVFFHKGHKVHGYGLYDTGNCLKDSYTGCGVHIISKQMGEKLHLSDEKAVLIPYTVLGKEQDLLKVYYLEQMCVYDRNRQKTEAPVAVGLSEDTLFDKKKYNVILNENIW